jgi:transposase-like protein
MDSDTRVETSDSGNNILQAFAVSEIPRTFEAALKWFSLDSNSLKCLITSRWPDGVVRCPVCGSSDIRFLESRQLWECKARHPKSQFSVRVGTILEGSHIRLPIWMTAIWMTANETKVSSHEVARRLGITQKSAWSMIRRIKFAHKKAGELPHPQTEEPVVRDFEPESPFWG